jgi:hypothetical protein
MLSLLRNRFGIPGVISVIALVFAMMGGAYAASNNGDGGKATASAKAKRGPKGPKGAKGDTGPAGPQGPAGAKGDTGAAGANGKDGTNGGPGSNGAAGANGKTVLSGAANPTIAVGTQGDFYINTTSDEIFGPKPSNAGAWGAGTKLKGADGAPGSPWVVGTAPKGVVMKGTWSVPYYSAAGAEEFVPIPISTGVPINQINGFTIFLKKGENLPGQGTPEREEAEGFCPGSAEEPEPSTAGFIALCVYVKEDTNLKVEPSLSLTQSGGGAVLRLPTIAAGPAKAFGSWVLVTE